MNHSRSAAQRTGQKLGPTCTSSSTFKRRLYSQIVAAGSFSQVPEICFVHTAKSSDNAAAVKRDGMVGQHFKEYFDKKQPVVLKQYANDFAAIEKWKDLNYLKHAVGPDIPCDVEIGAYNQGEKLTIPFEAYIDYLRLWMENYGEEADDSTIATPSDQLLYLAQNDLSMFGSLSDDVHVPSFCKDGRFLGSEGRLYSVMFWMGPRGCLSPLHYDPLDNILMQMVGRKRVTLLSSEIDGTRCLYTGEDNGQQYNTSAVDIEAPDLELYPLFQEVLPTSMTTVIGPGDVLFIPSQWWHHVRSLDLSISVNVWWR